ncbi:hypothetical protein AMJ82_05630 [candidate division TA06 bacterium SM23_40]|uniref:Lipocalin-like domain-containing protein n=1 Tax=candidate division TA06 bacterium SM23_40 TaxID=1703774 RepID=A0A0S8G8G4_UNCT6|nr:MAG: hypothetical protein AMJ82_05630 [candidate division TA06 bacterium SM23_40]
MTPSAKIALGVILGMTLVGCGDDGTGPSTPPDVKGTYDATYSFETTFTGGGSSGTCPGTLRITGQRGQNFSGDFTIQPSDCRAAAGGFTGTVQASGAVTIRGLFEEWINDETGATGLTCSGQAGQNLTGTFSGDELIAESGTVPLTCDDIDYDLEVSVTATRSAP